LKSSTLTLTLGNPSRIPEAVGLLRSSSNLYDQVDLLHYIVSCNSIDYKIDMKEIGMILVKDLIQEVYEKAARLRLWGIVRHCAGILHKVVNRY
jgi:phosphorylase kinase alpha/beta subunit